MNKEEKLDNLLHRALSAYEAAMVAFEDDDEVNFLKYRERHHTLTLQYITLKSGKTAAADFEKTMQLMSITGLSAALGGYIN